MRPQLQRLFARGEGSLPHTCIVDVGAVGRWLHEVVGPKAAATQWADLVASLATAPRRIVWVATLPSRASRVFGKDELQAAVQQLLRLGVQHVVESTELLTSVFAPQTSMFAYGESLALPETTVVAGAQVHDYPEQLFVLEGAIDAVLDLATGIAHTYWSQYRDRAGEPAFIPLVQAAVTGDPRDARRRPLGGKSAPGHASALDRLYQGPAHPDAGCVPLPPGVPRYMLDSLGKNAERIYDRARELVGLDRDPLARAKLEAALLQAQGPFTMPVADPLVVVAVTAGTDGNLKLATPHAFALTGTTQHEATGESAVLSMLKKLAKYSPGRWVAPRALDLLGYMSDHGIPLPGAVVDPAHCAFVLCPDDVAVATSLCPTAFQLAPAVAGWLWDVTRRKPAPPDLTELGARLPQIVDELRAQTKARGLDALIDDDIAKTVPVLAAMERRGAWVQADTAGIGAWLETEMDKLESLFRPVLGDVSPYEASPDVLVRVLSRRGLSLPDDRLWPGVDAKNLLSRLACVDLRIDALRAARTLSNVQRWMLRLDEVAGRLRGHHFPEVSGRWGMNADALQAMPKHSRGAKAMRKRLVGPPGTRLISADFSAFELRLVAGLSRDPQLLVAAQQRDAIGHLARQYFGSSYTGKHRAEMKRYLHPINYGAEAWGFVRDQVGIRTEDAANHYAQLRQTFGALFSWRGGMVTAMQQQGFARTAGGWQRDPGLAAAARSKRSGARWFENALVSTLVQGLAADIQRWCLRELARTLPKYDAELVFQNHDEIYVATVEQSVKLVRAELKRVLENGVRASGLVPAGILLVANVKEGTTWSDLA